MKESVFLTEGTGSLGTELAAKLCRMPDIKVYVSARGKNPEEAYCRLRRSWHHDKILCDSVGKTIFPVCSDVSLPGPGLREEDRAVIRDTVTLIIHSGAGTGFAGSFREKENSNHKGTENLLAFARGIKNLRHFVYISPAFGEKNKADENLVNDFGLPYSICRPGILAGDSVTGWTRDFKSGYAVLKRMLLGRVTVWPVSPDTPLNIVPADYAADFVLEICFAENAACRTFRLICPEECRPRAGELAEFVRVWAKENLAADIPGPVFVPAPGFAAGQVSDGADADRICVPFDRDWREYAARILAFASRKNFMKQSGQTVFEQAYVRRADKRHPVNYYNVSAEGITPVSGPEANRQIKKIYNALWAWGIRKGDRIALTGINSVEYLLPERCGGKNLCRNPAEKRPCRFRIRRIWQPSATHPGPRGSQRA